MARRTSETSWSGSNGGPTGQSWCYGDGDRKAKAHTAHLGLPALEDTLVQSAVARILGAIFAADFLPSSSGYRPQKSAREAVKALRHTLQCGPYASVVEADIRGFFDNMDHQWMRRMLAQRIDDAPFLRRIAQWLQAGILEEEGKVLHPATGTPQGGIVSPILANGYVHYALDLWCEHVVKKHSKGAVSLYRYADDFVCVAQYKEDAERFYRALPQRLSTFNLPVAEDKTRLMSCSRVQPGTSFDVLGFTFRWEKTSALPMPNGGWCRASRADRRGVRGRFWRSPTRARSTCTMLPPG